MEQIATKSVIKNIIETITPTPYNVQITNILPSVHESFQDKLISLAIPGIIGILGAILGIIIAEYFRRRERVSLFSGEVFKKRLAIYEGLFTHVYDTYNKAIELTEDKNKSAKEKTQLLSPLVIKLAEYTDKNVLYINENISNHILISLVGVLEIFEIPINKKIKLNKAINGLREEKNITIRLIKEDSGLQKLDNYFSNINKPKLKSEYIELLEKLGESKKG
jgi:hypothetical protein